MGEIAEMMLDGTLCECCGEYIDDDGAMGFPRYCSAQCARDRGRDDLLPPPPKAKGPRLNPNKTNCPKCMKRVKLVGLSDHLRDAHGHKGGE